MSNNMQSSILVVSDDQSLVESIISHDKDKYDFIARQSIDDVVNDESVLHNNSIVIFDIATVKDDVDTAIDKTIKLKQLDPTQIVIMLGDKEPLAEILNSNIQPLLFRAFNKPFSAGQLSLAYSTAQTKHKELLEQQAAGKDITTFGPAENRMNVDTLAQDRKSNSVVYIAVGVALLAILGWFFLSDSPDEAIQIAPVPEQTSVDEIEYPTDISSDIQLINKLNQKAAEALLDGRYIYPEGDNAIAYYDQVLAIDPYDSIAYEGKKQVADRLRVTFDQSLETAEFDKALPIISALQQLEPLNIDNDQLADRLKDAINVRVKSVQETGTTEEIAQTRDTLQKLEGKISGIQSATKALENEATIIEKIDRSIESDNLVPPQNDNAYTLLSNALAAGKISKANAQPRIESLNQKLLANANKSVQTKNLVTARKLSTLIKRLNVDANSVAALEKSIARMQAIINEERQNDEQLVKEKAKAEEESKPELRKIIPAKIISRPPPRYPARAINRDIEGWVTLSFKIDQRGNPFDIKVLDADPKNEFEKAAISSIKKWRFSPARNQSTGLPVVSSIDSTKVNFKLN